jgi:predicted ArsR family transcriptional regulator
MTRRTGPGQALHALSRLDDPVRRTLYDLVARREKASSRDEVARAAGIGRSLAAYHLDKLVADGLLVASYARTGGRSGPGAGRTSKLYRRSEEEFSVSLPARDYESAALLFADALDRDESGAAGSRLAEGARALGREAGRRHARGDADPDPLLGVLEQRGYEPARGADGAVRLGNCPFHHLAARYRDLVCGMNLALVEGVLEGLAIPAHAVLDPLPGGCCVAVLRGRTG